MIFNYRFLRICKVRIFGGVGMAKSKQELKINDFLQENENNLKIIKASINKFLKELSEGIGRAHV